MQAQYPAFAAPVKQNSLAPSVETAGILSTDNPFLPEIRSASSSLVRSAAALLDLGYVAMPVYRKRPADVVRDGIDEATGRQRWSYDLADRWTASPPDRWSYAFKQLEDSGCADFFGIGLRLGWTPDRETYLVALDFDPAGDETEAHRAILDSILDLWPSAPAKAGARGGTVILKCDPGLQLPPKLKIPGYGMLDVLAEGRQTAIAGAHTVASTAGGVRVTRRYAWLDSREIADEPADLPLLDEAGWNRLLEVLEIKGGSKPVAVGRVRDAITAPSNYEASGFERYFGALCMDHADQWLPELGLYGLRQVHGGWLAVPSYRPSKSGKPLDRRSPHLEISEGGGTDWSEGPKHYSHLELVAVALGLSKAAAWTWLISRLPIDPDLLVDDPFPWWQDNEPTPPASVPADEAQRPAEGQEQAAPAPAPAAAPATLPPLSAPVTLDEAAPRDPRDPFAPNFAPEPVPATPSAPVIEPHPAPPPAATPLAEVEARIRAELLAGLASGIKRNARALADGLFLDLPTPTAPDRAEPAPVSLIEITTGGGKTRALVNFCADLCTGSLDLAGASDSRILCRFPTTELGRQFLLDVRKAIAQRLQAKGGMRPGDKLPHAFDKLVFQYQGAEQLCRMERKAQKALLAAGTSQSAICELCPARGSCPYPQQIEPGQAARVVICCGDEILNMPPRAIMRPGPDLNLAKSFELVVLDELQPKNNLTSRQVAVSQISSHAARENLCAANNCEPGGLLDRVPTKALGSKLKSGSIAPRSIEQNERAIKVLSADLGKVALARNDLRLALDPNRDEAPAGVHLDEQQQKKLYSLVAAVDRRTLYNEAREEVRAGLALLPALDEVADLIMTARDARLKTDDARHEYLAPSWTRNLDRKQLKELISFLRKAQPAVTPDEIEAGLFLRGDRGWEMTEEEQAQRKAGLATLGNTRAVRYRKFVDPVCIALAAIRDLQAMQQEAIRKLDAGDLPDDERMALVQSTMLPPARFRLFPAIEQRRLREQPNEACRRAVVKNARGEVHVSVFSKSNISLANMPRVIMDATLNLPVTKALLSTPDEYIRHVQIRVADGAGALVLQEVHRDPTERSEHGYSEHRAIEEAMDDAGQVLNSAARLKGAALAANVVRAAGLVGRIAKARQEASLRPSGGVSGGAPVARATRGGKMRVGVVGPKAIVGAGPKAIVSEEMLSSDLRSAFGSTRGMNHLEDCEALYVRGRPMPPVEEIEALTSILFGKPVEVIDPKATRLGWIVGREGKVLRESPTYPGNDDHQQLWYVSCTAEVIQAIGRARAVHRDETKPVTILIGCSLPLPGVEVDELVYSDQLQALAGATRIDSIGNRAGASLAGWLGAGLAAGVLPIVGQKGVNQKRSCEHVADNWSFVTAALGKGLCDLGAGAGKTDVIERAQRMAASALLPKQIKGEILCHHYRINEPWERELLKALADAAGKDVDVEILPGWSEKGSDWRVHGGVLVRVDGEFVRMKRTRLEDNKKCANPSIIREGFTHPTPQKSAVFEGGETVHANVSLGVVTPLSARHCKDAGLFEDLSLTTLHRQLAKLKEAPTPEGFLRVSYRWGAGRTKSKAEALVKASTPDEARALLLQAMPGCEILGEAVPAPVETPAPEAPVEAMSDEEILAIALADPEIAPALGFLDGADRVRMARLILEKKRNAGLTGAGGENALTEVKNE